MNKLHVAMANKASYHTFRRFELRPASITSLLEVVEQPKAEIPGTPFTYEIITDMPELRPGEAQFIIHKEGRLRPCIMVHACWVPGLATLVWGDFHSFVTRCEPILQAVGMWTGPISVTAPPAPFAGVLMLPDLNDLSHPELDLLRSLPERLVWARMDLDLN